MASAQRNLLTKEKNKAAMSRYAISFVCFISFTRYRIIFLQVSVCIFADFAGWDDDQILAAVLAKSQNEYYEQLSNSGAHRNIEK